MNTSVNTIKSSIIEQLSQFVLQNPEVRLRYEYSNRLELHLIEVSPPERFGSIAMEQFDYNLTKIVSRIDLSQSVMFFYVGDADFNIQNPEFDQEGLLYQNGRKSGWYSKRSVRQGLNGSTISEPSQVSDYSYAMAA